MTDDWRKWSIEDKRTLLAKLKARNGAASKLHPRQREAMELPHEEGLYGGAAGGGKTEWGLEWLAEGAQYPKFSGLFLRRTFAQLSRSADSPIVRAFDIMGPRGGKWRASEKKWEFPNGAVIEFGHMQYEDSVTEYQGPSYHRVFYDELTQFSENQYVYLFSRMRKHKGFPIPTQIRAASNPGGPGEPGHIWVRRRFVTREAEEAIRAIPYDQPSPPGMLFEPTPDRFFLPARLADNPTLDIEDYTERMLKHLPVALRRRLLNGDWSAVEGALIAHEWLVRFRGNGDYLTPLDVNGDVLRGCEFNSTIARRFATIDTAGTSKKKEAERRGKPPSWSTCSVWDYDWTRDHLFLRHVWREKVSWGELVQGVQATIDDWSVPLAVIENAHFGPALAEELKRTTVKLVNPVIAGMKSKSMASGMGAKLERAVAAGLLSRFESRKLFTPEVSDFGAVPWLPAWEDEFLSWTGLEEETADLIDGASYACNEVRTPGQSAGKSWGGMVGTGTPRRRGKLTFGG